MHHQNLIQIEKNKQKQITDPELELNLGAMNKLVPPAVKRAHSDADQENCGRQGLCGMQRAAAAISPRCGVAGEAGVWPGTVTWEFWMWMVPGGSACVNTCPCDVTMATGWYRVPPEGIICRL